MTQRSGIIDRVLLVLGSQMFAIPMVSLVHEVGHIIAMNLVGITKYTLAINPFTESSATPLMSIPAENMLFVSASGMIFQTIIFSILAILLWRCKSVNLLPLMVCVPMSMLNVGGYLLMGSIVEGSDVILMGQAGVPSMVVQIIGVMFLVLGLRTYTRLLPVAGFTKESPVADIFTPLFLGTGIYPIAMTVYGYISGYGTMIGSINIVTSLIFGATYTLLFKRVQTIEPNTPSRADAYKVLGTGLTTIILSFLLF